MKNGTRIGSGRRLLWQPGPSRSRPLGFAPRRHRRFALLQRFSDSEKGKKNAGAVRLVTSTPDEYHRVILLPQSATIDVSCNANDSFSGVVPSRTPTSRIP